MDFKGLADKAKDLAKEHNEKVDQVIDKAGDAIDAKTGGKFASGVDKAQDAAKNAIDK